MRADKRPMLADLRESGIHRTGRGRRDVHCTATRCTTRTRPTSGTAEIIVAKHRNGPTGKAQLAFLGQYTRFANMAKGV